RIFPRVGRPERGRVGTTGFSRGAAVEAPCRRWSPGVLPRSRPAGSMAAHRPEAWSAGMRWIGMIAVAAAMAALSAACASNARSGEAAETAPAFSGTWAVRWCNKARPDLECGGFWVTLAQTGQHVCGEYDAALVNLRQIDEGRVTGRADGD